MALHQIVYLCLVVKIKLCTIQWITEQSEILVSIQIIMKWLQALQIWLEVKVKQQRIWILAVVSLVDNNILLLKDLLEWMEKS